MIKLYYKDNYLSLFFIKENLKIFILNNDFKCLILLSISHSACICYFSFKFKFYFHGIEIRRNRKHFSFYYCTHPSFIS